MLAWSAALLLAAAPTPPLPPVAPPVTLTMPVSLHAVQPTQATLLFESATPLLATVSYRVGEEKTWRTARDPAASSRHRLRLTGLQAAQLITYRIEGTAPATEGRFTTPPALGAAARVRFAVVGDSRDHVVWAGISEAIRQANPDFLLVTGDSVQGRGGDIDEEWRDYYRAAAPLFAHIPVYAVPGNHDVGDQYAPYNPDPGDGTGYAFAWGPLAVVALDSNHLATQTGWIAATLAALSGGPLFAFQHHPPYSCGVHGGSTPVRETWGPLFTQAHLTIDFAGHDHDLIDWGAVEGVHYTVSGGGGTVLYPLVGCHTPFALSSYGFVVVEVDRGQVTERFFDATGSLLFADGPFAAAGPTLDPKRAAAALSP